MKGKKDKLGSREDYSLGVSSYLIHVLWLQQEGFRASQRIIQMHFIQSGFTCLQQQFCVSPPGINAGVGDGDAGCGEDKLRAPLPAACVQPGGEGDWLPAETPLKDSVRSYSFPLTHCEKQKYCNILHRGTKGSAVINEHGGGSFTGGGEQVSADHLPLALGSLLCWPAADTMLSWTPEMLAKRQRHCSLCQAWFLSPRQGDCLSKT